MRVASQQRYRILIVNRAEREPINALLWRSLGSFDWLRVFRKSSLDKWLESLHYLSTVYTTVPYSITLMMLYHVCTRSCLIVYCSKLQEIVARIPLLCKCPGAQDYLLLNN